MAQCSSGEPDPDQGKGITFVLAHMHVHCHGWRQRQWPARHATSRQWYGHLAQASMRLGTCCTPKGVGRLRIALRGARPRSRAPRVVLRYAIGSDRWFVVSGACRAWPAVASASLATVGDDAGELSPARSARQRMRATRSCNCRRGDDSQDVLRSFLLIRSTSCPARCRGVRRQVSSGASSDHSSTADLARESAV